MNGVVNGVVNGIASIVNGSMSIVNGGMSIVNIVLPTRNGASIASSPHGSRP